MDDIKIKLEPAKENDLIRIFELSNDNIVRENSFQSDRINFNDHKRWFSKKLNDNNSLILMATSEDEFVGQIRFDFGKENVMGVSITKDFRGLGLGSILIKKGLNYVESNKIGANKITAYIKDTNISSIKSFEKAGFRLDDSIKINGIKALRYICKIGQE